MHLVYIDDSNDPGGVCFSAILIPAVGWQGALDHLIALRRQLWESDRIYIRKELHATDFLGGRGRISPKYVPKGARARIFDFVLSGIALLPDAQLVHGTKGGDERLFDFLLNRINTNMRYFGSHALLISDEGKSYDSMLRIMRRVNYIPSRFGSWYSGDFT